MLYSRWREPRGDVRKVNDAATHITAAHFTMQQKSRLLPTAETVT